MSQTVTDQLQSLPQTQPRPGRPSSGQGTNTGIVPAALRRKAVSSQSEPLIVVPAGIFGNMLGGLAGTIGEVTGGWFGNKELGKTLGEAAGPLISHFSPFQVYVPSLAPQSAGPGAAPAPGPDEAVVVVPAGFLTGLLGGVGGGLLGGVVGDLFGNKKLGSDIGTGLGGAVGSVFGPFSVVPPTVDPAAATPGAAPEQSEAMVVVPAGFFGNLIGAAAGSIGNLIAGERGQQIGDIAGHLAQQLLPWSSVAPDFAPQSTGPDGTRKADDLVVVPAFWLGNILKNYGDIVSSPLLKNLVLNSTSPGGGQGGVSVSSATPGDDQDIAPFHAVPQALAPQSASGETTQPEDQLMFVPAGLFGSLLSGLGSTLGGAVGGLFGNASTGQAIGTAVGQLGQFLPFSVIEPSSVR